MTNLKRPKIGLFFLQRNSTILDMPQRVLNFYLISMQLNHADNTYSNISEPLLNPIDILIQPRKQITSLRRKRSNRHNQPSPNLEDNDDLIICPVLATTQNRKFTVLINSFTQHPYTLKKGCHIAIFSILTPEQTKYIKPVNSAPLHYF